jgi:hypothetical protein
VVTITGGGFPGNSTIYAHLAPLGGSGGSGNEYANYAIVATTPTGDYTMIFAMPAVWPNGTPIKTGRIAILIATADFSRQTSVSFDYVGVTAAEQPTAVPVETAVPAPTNTPVPPLAEPPTVVPADTPTEIPIEVPTETLTETPTEIPTVIPADSDGQSTIPPALIPGEPTPIEPGN